MSAFDITPLFLESPQGRIFVIHRTPQASDVHSGVVLVPPFAEEMNRSRRMLTLLAEALADAGYHTVLPDFFGTGDSEGEFVEASWSGWLDQLACCVESLQRDYGIERYSLVAVRAGALVAADYLRRAVNMPERLVLWQPVIDGGAYLSQFLRLRLAADMLSEEKNRETLSSMKQQLEAGQTIEVAGYALTSAISDGLSSSSLKQIPPEHLPPTCWIDLVSSEGQVSPQANRKLVDAFAEVGGKICYTVCTGLPFWNSVETVENSEIIAKTAIFLRGDGDVC